MKHMFKPMTWLLLPLASLVLMAGDPIKEIEKIMHLHESRAQLLILGTFHFKDPGLDGYKPKHEINIFSPKRQKEVQEVVDLLAKFKPTKIALEWKPKYREDVDKEYKAYLEGNFKLKANEVYQLGFRLGKQLGHAKLYLSDAPGRWFKEREDVEKFAIKNGQTDLAKAPVEAHYTAFYEYEDKLKMETTLKDYFMITNHETIINLNHGHYMVGTLEVGDGNAFPGVDGFVSSWYNRNLRIFSNLLRLRKSKQERILLIIGSGHVPIIRHAAQTSPQFELVEVADVLGK